MVQAHLGVLFPHIGEKIVDEFAHKVTRMIDPCYQLWNHLCGKRGNGGGGGGGERS